MKLAEPELQIRRAPSPASLGAWHIGLLFCLFTLGLVWVDWSAIRQVNFELGDFAANSLLVQDAKSGLLLKGNYSRVGFNHPGPAILDVLAFGEVVFHDWLHVARSPLSGQLIGVALYGALWLTMISRILKRMSGSLTAATLGVSVFILVASALEYQVFKGLWFPHLYFLPFAAMALAASRLVYGRTDSLVALGVASGFLINGHVSFVAVIAIVLVAVVLANWLLARADPTCPRFLSVAFLRANARPLAGCVAIVALFLLPMLINTVLHFPGPAAQYAAFSGKNKPNTIAQTFKYVSVYWGGGVVSLLIGMAALRLLWLAVATPADAFSRAARSLIVVFLASTFALLFYARYGIDMLDQKYIGLYYYAVPALLLALVCILSYLRSAWRYRQHLALGFSLLCLVVAFKAVSKPVEYLEHYNKPEIPAMYQALAAVPHSGRLVLDPDTATDWPYVWSNLLGIEAFAKRHHDDLFCINKNWHISFTPAAACTAHEVATGTRLIVRKTEAWPAGAPQPLLEGGGLSWFAFTNPNLIGAGMITVSSRPAVFSGYILQQGWSSVESEFVWSEGKQAMLGLRVAPGFRGTLTLDLGAFLPRPDMRQSARVTIGGVEVATIDFDARSNRRQVSIVVPPVNGPLLLVTLDIARPISPADVGAADTRKLGVAFYGFKLEEL